jgi:hypothetical protein
MRARRQRLAPVLATQLVRAEIISFFGIWNSEIALSPSATGWRWADKPAVAKLVQSTNSRKFS